MDLIKNLNFSYQITTIIILLLHFILLLSNCNYDSNQDNKNNYSNLIELDTITLTEFVKGEKIWDIKAEKVNKNKKKIIELKSITLNLWNNKKLVLRINTPYAEFNESTKNINMVEVKGFFPTNNTRFLCKKMNWIYKEQKLFGSSVEFINNNHNFKSEKLITDIKSQKIILTNSVRVLLNYR